MANPFDDLVPAQPKGVFDDLIPQRTGGEKAARLVGQFAQNANDVIASTLGLPVDAIDWIRRKTGIGEPSPSVKGVVNEQITGQAPARSSPAPFGGSESIKSGLDYIATLPGRIGDAASQGSLAPFTDSRTSRFDPENRQERIAAGTGAGVGALLTTLLPAGAVARAATPGGVTERIASALASQPAMQTASAVAGGAATGATDNPYVGLAASLLVPAGASAARGVISPIRNRLTAEEQRLIAVAEAEGVPVTPAQRTGSPALRGIEETLARTPLASGPMQESYANQRGAFNSAVMDRTGMPAANAAPATLDAAFHQAGQNFDNLVSRTTLDLSGPRGAQFAQEVGNVVAQQGRRLPTDQAPVFASYVQDLQPLLHAIQQGVSHQIGGAEYQQIRSSLATRIRALPQNDPTGLRPALTGLQNALDGAMERSATGTLADEWRTARQQYQALMTVDKAMQGGTQADRAAGNIPFSALKSSTVQGDRAGFSRGRGQMNDLARLGDFLSTRVPNSGTPERMMWANLLSGGSLLGGGGIAAAGGMTPGALAAGAAAVAAPAVVSRLYNTGPVQAYLANQVAGHTNFAPLLAMEGGRQVSMDEDRRMRELARLLMRANGGQ